MSGLSATRAADAVHEAGQFAETVASVVARHRASDPWSPGAAVSDACPELMASLAEAGWPALAEDPELLAFAGPAAVELGRGLASLEPVDLLLGGALCDRPLARYGEPGARLVTPRAGRLEHATGGDREALPYTDSLGVVRIASARPVGVVEGPEAGIRMRAWIAASAGYVAGACDSALQLAIEHTRSRVAFGRPLAALEPVQQTLADAATITDGLLLLAREEPGADALLYAGEAAERAVAGAQQVTGALGFTLEFPLGRAHRRVRASRVWAEAALTGWEGGER